ncbi:MAG: [Fe-Fe] hydrogenase large subunit C-terminal domain-containing protein [candidate division Zixibacteria bacterium]
MTQFFHAHKVDADKCRGHMTCMRHCPTQAIRVRNGKAEISNELCVDCGECLSVCPSGAIVPIADPVDEISSFKYRVVVPSPVLYSQFEGTTHPYIIHLALKELGFHEVVDVTTTSAAMGQALVKYMNNYRGRRPLISSFCPSIIRLIQVKYPDLVELVVPLDVPREVTAREIRKTLPAKLGIKPEEIGIFYLATCPAKIVSIKQPAEKAKSWFNGVVSISDAYSVLMHHVVAIREQFDESQVPKDFSFHSGWVTTGSITQSVKMENWLAVSGLDHVKQILDDIENSRLRNIAFVEALAHMLGCINGPFNVENPYVARANSIRQRELFETKLVLDDTEIEKRLNSGYYFFEHRVLPRPTAYFDTDLATSIKRMKERERVYKNLKQIDCGCCGSPTCMSFAEDFVCGDVKLTDCIFLSEKSSAED